MSQGANKWPKVKLNEIKAKQAYSFVGGPFGSNLTIRDYVDEGVPVIRGGNLPFDRFFLDEEFVFVTEEKANKLKPNTAYPGDVIFTQRGTLGQVGVIPENSAFPKYIISQSQMKLTVDKEIAEARFVYYLFRMPDIVKSIVGHVLTSGVPHINLTILRNFEISLPPKDMQSRIIDILSVYDDLIDNNRRRMALLEEAARQLYQEWFVRLRFPGHEHTKIKNGVPEGWEKKSVYDSFDILSGGTPRTTNPSFWDGEIPFYTPKDAAPGVWVTECERTITETGLNNCNSRLYPKETVFISARGTVGKLNMAQRPMAMSQSCYALRGRGNISQMFLFCAMESGVDALKQHAVGAVFDAIIVDTFKHILLLVPEPNIVRLFDEFMRPIFQQIENLTLQNQKVLTARNLLLPRFMNGEISI